MSPATSIPPQAALCLSRCAATLLPTTVNVHVCRSGKHGGHLRASQARRKPPHGGGHLMAKVYLASPYGFSESSKGFLKELREKLRASGHTVHDPWEVSEPLV